MHALFSGGLGPPRAFVECVAGPRTEPVHVINALETIATRSAPNVVVFFSGKCSVAGLHLASGVVEPAPLQSALTAMAARNILLILDLDIGAEVDAGLSPDWLRRLVAHRAGVRAAVCRATRIGSGVDGEGLGRFTAAMISALDSAPGDLRFELEKFISDKTALERASAILNERWGMTNLPIILGEVGGLPLTRSQHASALGSCVLTSVKPLAGLAASVSWEIEGRANVATSLHYVLVRLDGTALCQASTTILPAHPVQKGKTTIKFAKSALGPRTNAPQLDQLEWHVSLVDSHGRSLATAVSKLT